MTANRRMTSYRVGVAPLAAFGARVLVCLGMAEADAALVSESLVTANLWGHSSHGIGILTTNGSPAMAPWGGREKTVGANPRSIAAPGGDSGPVVLDIANTAVARGTDVIGPYVPDGRGGCGHQRMGELIAATKAVPLAPGFDEIFCGVPFHADLRLSVLPGRRDEPLDASEQTFAARGLGAVSRVNTYAEPVYPKAMADHG